MAPDYSPRRLRTQPGRAEGRGWKPRMSVFDENPVPIVWGRATRTVGYPPRRPDRLTTRRAAVRQWRRRSRTRRHPIGCPRPLRRRTCPTGVPAGAQESAAGVWRCEIRLTSAAPARPSRHSPIHRMGTTPKTAMADPQPNMQTTRARPWERIRRAHPLSNEPMRAPAPGAANGSEEPYRVIPTIGALSTWPSMEPRKGTPKLKIPPSAAIR